MEEVKRTADGITAENVHKKAEYLWTTMHRKYIASLAIQAVLNIGQLALAGSIVALNIYVTRYSHYQVELFVAIVVLMSFVTLVSSLALFLKLRARARRNRFRYILAVKEAAMYRQKKGYYANPKTRDERIVKRLAQIKAWRNDPVHH